jgi:hypothetical protein
MPERHWERVKKDLNLVMAAIEARRGHRRPVLVSGLAEGADRLAAFVALGRGWSLRAILAFPRARFEQDFQAPFALGEFRALLDAAEAIEEPKQSAQARRRAEDGYHAVAQRLLALSDVLIAVWDGEGSRGPGGAVEVIERARARGIPIIWVHAKKAQKPRHI